MTNDRGLMGPYTTKLVSRLRAIGEMHPQAAGERMEDRGIGLCWIRHRSSLNFGGARDAWPVGPDRVRWMRTEAAPLAAGMDRLYDAINDDQHHEDGVDTQAPHRDQRPSREAPAPVGFTPRLHELIGFQRLQHAHVAARHILFYHRMHT